MKLNIGISITKNKKKYLELTKNIREKSSVLNLIYLPTKKELLQKIENIDILLTYAIPKEIFQYNIQSLKWIQLGNAGVDNSMFKEVLQSKIIITNSRGINAIPVSEFVMSSILYFEKNLMECINFKKNKIWNQWELAKKNDTLENKVIGLIGYGAIGKAIAKRAKSFNMKIYAVRRLQKKRLSNSNIDMLMPLEDLDYLLTHSDFIVIACPLTPLTFRLITKDEIKKCKKNAYIINISRGQIIDEKDLIDCLKNNVIKGAALDVFDEEPLNQKSALFNCNNVLLSPHISGNFIGYQNQVIKSFEENLNRFVNKKNLKNRVCKKRQY